MPVASRTSGLCVVLAGLVVSSSGCSDTCHAGDGEYVRYSEGQTLEDGEFYQTGPIQGPYLHFPSGRIFELTHALLGAPNDVTIYLSFDEDALLGSEGNNIAPSAGNQAVVECVDAEIVRVRNDTCAEFYLRVTAEFNGPGLSSPQTRPCRPEGETAQR